jgi:GT2 family glycosyltransferase
MARSLLVIVLHYKGLDDTVECVASLVRQSYENIHTIVVDNASGDKVGSCLANVSRSVEVMEMDENKGWSGGNNAGIRLAMARGYDFVCLLNNDTVLPDNTFTKLIESAEFLGPCILHPAIDSYGVDEDVQLDPQIPQPPDLRVTPVPGQAGLYEISIMNGACALIELSIFKHIGLIDDRFFLLCEDADFGLRAVSAEYRLYCDSTIRIRHKESRSFGGRRKPIKTYYGIRNTLLFRNKHGQVVGSLLPFWRYVAWTVWRTAGAAGVETRSWIGLFFWCLSGDRFARAIRMGMRDYLLRRFGRLNRRDETILTTDA